MKSIIFVAMAAVLLGSASAQATTNPASVIAKVLEVRLSQKSDCSSAITVFKSASPTTVDLLANPVLGSGVAPNGTYHCVAVHISDLFTVTPAADDGANCHVGVSFTEDIFTNPGVGNVSYTPEGTIINGSATEDDPWIYFTDSTDAQPSNSCFMPPFADCHCVNTGPCPVTPITINSDQTHTVVINFDNAVGDFGNGRCELHLPKMALR